MGSFRRWLQRQPSQLVPLFASNESLVVETRIVGKRGRRVLCRHPRMEHAIETMVEAGLSDPGWRGLLYIMGWGPNKE